LRLLCRGFLDNRDCREHEHANDGLADSTVFHLRVLFFISPRSAGELQGILARWRPAVLMAISVLAIGSAG
jgi:hypothetical protein